MSARETGPSNPVSIFIILLFGVRIAAGVTYYVDANNGSDTNGGTSADTPWQSIGQLNTVNLAPGDTVLLKRGSIWNEQLMLYASGTSDQPITIADYGSGNKPLLLGASNSRSVFHVYGQSYIYVRNIAVAQGVYGFLFDAGSAYNTLESVEASFNKYDGIGFQDSGSVGNTVINSICHDNGRSGVFFWSGADKGAVIGGTYYNNNNSMSDGSGVAVGRSAGAVISGVTSYANLYGISTYGSEASNIVIRNNTIYNNSRVGIDLDYSGTAIIVQKNTIFNNGGHGIDVEGITEGSIIRYNTSHHNGTGNHGGILLDGSKGVQVYYNVVHDEPVGIWGLGADSPSIYNNVVYQSSTCISMQSGALNVKLENNIAGGCDAAALFINSDSGAGLISNYNDWSVNNAAKMQWGSQTYTLAQWQVNVLQDLASIDADPLFVNPNQNDFQLGAGSPALGIGANIGLALDIDGTPIPQASSVDIGSYQSPNNSVLGPVQLVARHSGECLDVPGASVTAGIQVQQWLCWGGTNQQWLLMPTGYGYYQITSVNSQMSLGVAGMSTGDGAPVLQQPYGGGTNESWQLQPTSDGYYQIVVQQSGKCLDVTGGPNAVQNGIQVQQWLCWGGTNQQWQLVPLM